MTKKPIKLVCWAAVAVSFIAANYATQHSWPIWTITIAGAVFIGAVVTYLLTAQSQ